MKKTLTLLVLVASLFPVTALAQDRGRPAEVDPVTSYTFTDGSAVEGGRYNPSEDLVRGQTRRRRDTLVRPRTHYVNEMLKSVENL